MRLFGSGVLYVLLGGVGFLVGCGESYVLACVYRNVFFY